MSCIDSEHLSTVAGGDFNFIFQLAYKKLIETKTKSEVIEIEEGFQYAFAAQWCVIARLEDDSYALVSSANLSSCDLAQKIIEEVRSSLSREQALRMLVTELELQEQLASQAEIAGLLEKQDLDGITKIEKRIENQKAFRKDIINGASPYTARIQAGMTNPYPH